MYSPILTMGAVMNLHILSMMWLLWRFSSKREFFTKGYFSSAPKFRLATAMMNSPPNVFYRFFI